MVFIEEINVSGPLFPIARGKNKSQKYSDLCNTCSLVSCYNRNLNDVGQMLKIETYYAMQKCGFFT